MEKKSLMSIFKRTMSDIWKNSKAMWNAMKGMRPLSRDHIENAMNNNAHMNNIKNKYISC